MTLSLYPPSALSPHVHLLTTLDRAVPLLSRAELGSVDAKAVVWATEAFAAPTAQGGRLVVPLYVHAEEVCSPLGILYALGDSSRRIVVVAVGIRIVGYIPHIHE
jgi:hypothetical protein